MSIVHNARIPLSGLISCFDAANTKSYPGTGTVWTDLIGSYTGTLTSTTFSTDAGGCIETNGTTASHGDITGLDLSAADYTVVCASRYLNVVSTGRVLGGRNNNWLLGHYASKTLQYYAGNAFVHAAGSLDTNWRIYAGTGDITGDLFSFYVNGEPLVEDSTNGNAGPNELRFGKSYADNQPSDCQVSFILVYNRVLTADEIQQVFYAYRGRFGL